MVSSLTFTKASGAGNDFVIIDNMGGKVSLRAAALAPALCDRHFGIGADGLLVLEESSRADFLMQYYNADGSYGGMCGNGGRCAARYLFLKGLVPAAHRFEALDHIYEAWVEENTVRLHMKDPVDLRAGLRLEIPEGTFTGTFLNTGAPHLVVFVQDIDRLNLRSIGPALRNYPSFGAAGTNVNFVSVRAPQGIALRTYERGVEAETLACGTGSIAAAVVSCLEKGIKPPVRIAVRSGEELLVSMKQEGGRPTGIMLEGSARMVFTGECLYDAANHSIVDFWEHGKEMLP
jgi:diaminopimelate epimerase